MFTLLDCKVVIFDCLVTPGMAMGLWRSTPLQMVGGGYARIAHGLTVMQLLSARTWDMPVELLSHLSWLSVVQRLECLLLNFMMPAVHPELGIHVPLACALSSLSLYPQDVTKMSLLLLDVVSNDNNNTYFF